MNQYKLFQKNGYVSVKTGFKFYNLNYVFEILDYIIQTELLCVEFIGDWVVLRKKDFMENEVYLEGFWVEEEKVGEWAYVYG